MAGGARVGLVPNSSHYESQAYPSPTPLQARSCTQIGTLSRAAPRASACRAVATTFRTATREAKHLKSRGRAHWTCTFACVLEKWQTRHTKLFSVASCQKEGLAHARVRVWLCASARARRLTRLSSKGGGATTSTDFRSLSVR